VLAGATLVISNGVAAAANTIGLVAAGGVSYPERSYILTLPTPRELAPGNVHILENGTSVAGLKLAKEGTATSRSAVVIVLDESLTMRGAPIKAAFAAARAFAAHANPSEEIAVVAFNGSIRVIQPFTTSAAVIDAALSKPPRIQFGTRNYDAIDMARRMIAAEDVASGSVVVLTDGQSVENVSDPVSVVRRLTKSHIRVFAIGLKSLVFQPAPLQRMAARTGGQYVLAAGPKQLGPIFTALGNRLSSEYVVDYRTTAQPGVLVVVRVSIDGVPGYASTAYSTPSPNTPAAKVFRPSQSTKIIQSSYTMAFVAIGFAVLIGFAITHMFANRPEALVDRVSDFVAVQRVQAKAAKPTPEGRKGPGILAQLAANTNRQTLIDKLTVALDLARIEAEPLQVILLTIGVTVFLMFLLLVIFGPLGFLAGLMTPLIVRALIKRRIAATRKAFAEQLPDNLDVLASALRAGHSLVSALSVVADDADEPSRTEFQRVLAEEQFGAQLEDAFQIAVERMQNSDLDQVALVSRLQREMGSNSAEVLDRVIETVRARMELRRLIRTLTAQGQLSRWILTLLPVCIALLLTVVSSGYMHPLFHRTAGQLLLVMAAGLVVLGSWLIGKIVNIKLA
jgi:tight adherence protein B